MVAMMLAGITSTFALTVEQFPEFGGFSPEDGTEVSANQTITFNFKSAPEIAPTVGLITGGGFAQNVEYVSLADQFAAGKTEYEVKLDESNWGRPYFEQYFLTVVVTFTTGDGDDMEFVEDADGNWFEEYASYYRPDNAPASVVMTYPNNSDFNEYFTFADAYEEGIGTVFFSKEVNIPAGSIGTIDYLDDMGLSILDEPMRIDEYEAEWSQWDGLFAISFLWNNAEYDPEDIYQVSINLKGISNGDQVLPINITLVNDGNDSVLKKSKAVKTANIFSSILENESSFDIMTVDGKVLAIGASVEVVKALNNGLYIVNGRKIVIR